LATFAEIVLRRQERLERPVAVAVGELVDPVGRGQAVEARRLAEQNPASENRRNNR